MADFLSDLSRELVPVACQVAEALFKALTTRPGVNVEVVARFSSLAGQAASRNDLDPSAYLSMLSADLEHETALAVRGYVDWAACAIIRSDDYSARPLPMPDAIAIAAIAVKSGANPCVIVFTADRLRELDAVPVLGRVDQGRLIPNRARLDLYKACFDWSGGA